MKFQYECTNCGHLREFPSLPMPAPLCCGTPMRRVTKPAGG